MSQGKRALVLVIALVAGGSAARSAGPPSAASSSPVPSQSLQFEPARSHSRLDQQLHPPRRPADGLPPNNATAQCRDGTFSFSQHHRGTCSHHGGVGTWLR